MSKNFSQCENEQMAQFLNENADKVDLNHKLPIELSKSYKRTIRVKDISKLTNYHIITLLFVEDIGVEPMTLCVQGRCSSQLS